MRAPGKGGVSPGIWGARDKQGPKVTYIMQRVGGRVYAVGQQAGDAWEREKKHSDGSQGGCPGSHAPGAPACHHRDRLRAVPGATSAICTP